jgi:DNA-binding response OmpR family regulator
VLREAFEQAGCECITAFDGRTALARARMHQPELVILEADLPGINGLEVCRLLRTTPPGQSRPLTIVLARGRDFDDACGATVGADDFVRKPFGVTEVLERARRLLQWHGRWSGGRPRMGEC